MTRRWLYQVSAAPVFTEDAFFPTWYRDFSRPVWSVPPLPVAAYPYFFIDSDALTRPETVFPDKYWRPFSEPTPPLPRVPAALVGGTVDANEILPVPTVDVFPDAWHTRWIEPPIRPTFRSALQQTAAIKVIDPGPRTGVEFDGTNDYIVIAGAIGNDGKTHSGSLWVKLDAAGDGTRDNIWLNNGGRCRLRRESNDIFELEYRTNDTGGGEPTAIEIHSTNTFTSADGWLHLVWAVDVSHTDSSKCWLYINDVDETNLITYVQQTTFDLNFARGDVGVAATNLGANKLNGAMQEFWLPNTGDWFDLSVDAERRKFSTAQGEPADLGQDGSTPTGTQPLIYLNNPFSNFEVNKGSIVQSDITLNGTLTDEGTLPSYTPPITVTLDSWYSRWAEPPVRPRFETVYQQSFTMDLVGRAESVFPDKYWQPFSEPLHDLPRAQLLGGKTDANEILPGPVVEVFPDAWYARWTEPPIRFTLNTAQQRAFTIDPWALTRPETVFPDKWWQPFAEPTPPTPSFLASMQQFLYIDPAALTLPEFAYPSHWEQPYSRPTPPKSGQLAAYQEFLFIDPEILTRPEFPGVKWFQPFAEPVPPQPGLHAALQQPIAADDKPVVPFEWFRQIAEPIILPVVLQEQLFETPFIEGAPGPGPAAIEWYNDFSLPVWDFVRYEHLRTSGPSEGVEILPAPVPDTSGTRRQRQIKSLVRSKRRR